MFKAREKSFLLDRLDRLGVLQVLKGARAVIAGGAIRAVFTDTPIHDYDLYFRSAEDRDRAIAFLRDSQNGFERLVVTEAAITFRKDGAVLQVIRKDDFLIKSVEELIDAFDYTICMGAYDLAEDRLYLGEDFLKHNAQRRLVFNPGAKYPIASLFRVKKYLEYGYKISGTELVKIALTINKTPIITYADLKEQLLGVDTLFLYELTAKLGSQELAYKDYRFDEFMHMLEEHISKYYGLFGFE